MPVTSIFSFSHNVFYPSQNKFNFFINIYSVICKCSHLDHSRIFWCGKELNAPRNATWHYHIGSLPTSTSSTLILWDDWYIPFAILVFMTLISYGFRKRIKMLVIGIFSFSQCFIPVLKHYLCWVAYSLYFAFHLDWSKFSLASQEIGRVTFPDYLLYIFNSLPNIKILDHSKLTGFADDKINVTDRFKFPVEGVENIVENRKKCRLLAFSLFPTMFTKGFFLEVVGTLDCVRKS